MVVKVNLEKAYDRVHWDFLRDTFTDARLPSTIIRTIMRCVSSSSMQLVGMGVFQKNFFLQEGTRRPFISIFVRVRYRETESSY